MLCLPSSGQAVEERDAGSEREELGWQQGAASWEVKTGQHQRSKEEIQHGRLRGLHRLSCSNATLESARKDEKTI